MTTGFATGRFVDLLIGPSPRAARSSVLDLVEGGMPPRKVYVDVLAPAMREVGRRWQVGVATVAQEHLATAIVRSVMATLAPELEEPPPVGRRIILACSEGEMHDVGLRMVGDFLEADGWDTMYLGAVTPEVELVELARTALPDAIGISTTLTTHLASVAATIEGLRANAVPALVLVGGRAYGDDPEVARRIGADLFAVDAEETSNVLRKRFDVA